MKNTKTITIMVIVDVIGALSTDTLDGNLYLFDNNKTNGSIGEGSQELKTKLSFKDKEEINLVWNVMSLEPESFIDISDIITDDKYLQVEKNTYKDSDVMYWKGIVKKSFNNLPYQLSIKVGNRDMEFLWDLELISDSSQKA